MRENKFRVWSNFQKRYNTLQYEALNGNVNPIDNELIFSKECILEQYTGLKDKNGVEIYEGDIVQTPYGKREVMFGKIGYDNSWNGLTGFYFKDAIIKTTTYSEFDNRKEETLFMELGYGFSPLDIEVIGNIHEQ